MQRRAPRKARRNRRKAAIPRRMPSKVHFFKQTFFPTGNSMLLAAGSGGSYGASSGILRGPSTSGGGGDQFFAYQFLLSDLPQAATFTAMFDAYKVNKLIVKFVPYANVQAVVANTSAGADVTGIPQFMQTVIDYDDSTNLTTHSSLLEYENYKETKPQVTHKRSYVPALSANVYKTGGATIAYSQKKKVWVDAGNTDVPHYGIKGCIQGNGSSSIQNAWKVFVTAYLSFRQVR